MSRAESGPFETATFDHVAVSVSDLDAMVSFYESVFGFAVEGRTSFPALGIRTALLALATGTRLELTEAADSGGQHAPVGPAEAAKRRGYYHWALEVADLEAASAIAVAGGATLLLTPSNAAREGMRYAYLADPDGNLIELISTTSPKSSCRLLAAG